MLFEDLHTQTMPHMCGFVAIVGLPNTGKSTLVNRYLREKVTIVSPKPQTTRTNVTTILSSKHYQVIFIDTPGLLKPRYKMQKVMAAFIINAVKESDVILLIIDASAFKHEHHPAIISFADELKAKSTIIALNKIDVVKKSYLLPLLQKTSELFPNVEIVPISALDGDGADELFSIILKNLPEGPKLYPEEIISNEPERFFASELIREAVFLMFRVYGCIEAHFFR